MSSDTCTLSIHPCTRSGGLLLRPTWNSPDWIVCSLEEFLAAYGDDRRVCALVLAQKPRTLMHTGGFSARYSASAVGLWVCKYHTRPTSHHYEGFVTAHPPLHDYRQAVDDLRDKQLRREQELRLVDPALCDTEVYDG